MNLIDHFGLLAPFYDRLIGRKLPDKLIKLLDVRGVDALLDAGGGTGRVTQHMVGLAEQVFVADLSFKMLTQAQKKVGINTICSKSEQMPFPGSYFDRIIMVDALHHVINHQVTANELWRVLKPGGRLVIEEPNIGKFGVKLIAILEKLAFMRSHFLSPQQIAGLFAGQHASIDVEIDEAYGWVIVQKRQN